MATPTSPAGDPATTTPAPDHQQMRAIVQRAYGMADVLHLAEIDRPAIGVGGT
jgi:hypothetical protein